jgi:hypothetical protein
MAQWAPNKPVVITQGQQAEDSVAYKKGGANSTESYFRLP